MAEFVAASQFDTLPDAVVDRTKYLVLDGLACGLVGAQLPWSRVAAEALIDLEGHGPATVWGWDQGTTPSTAALINGTFVQGFELDDYHEFGPLHSESIILPAAMATAQKIGGVSGTDLLVAAAMGFEFGPRLGIVMDGHDLIAQGWHCGVIYGSIAAALTTARLRGLDAEHTSSAMGLAATQASGLMAAQFEAMVKRMNHAFAGRAGVIAGALAERGFTGIKDSLERDYGGLVPTFTHKPNSELDYGPLTRDLGADWELMRILVKPYASGGTTHPGVDAMLHLRNDLGVSADDIESIKIRLPIHSFRHYGWKISRPTTNIGAQMNLCFVCAITLLDGKASIGQFSNAPHRRRRRLGPGRPDLHLARPGDGPDRHRDQDAPGHGVHGQAEGRDHARVHAAVRLRQGRPDPHQRADRREVRRADVARGDRGPGRRHQGRRAQPGEDDRRGRAGRAAGSGEPRVID